MKKTVGGVDHYYVPANYSGWYTVNDHVWEHLKLSYFTEDVGLNAFYVAASHDFPYWMNSAKHHLPQNIRGELYMYMHKQLLVRYYLERLSHNFGEIDYVDVNRPIPAYYPTMQHPNGMSFPQRPVGFEVPVHMHKDVQVSNTLIITSIKTKMFKKHPKKMEDIL